MPRRNRIPFEHRERLVRAFEDVNEDYLVVSDTLGINRSTARGIVSRYVRQAESREDHVEAQTMLGLILRWEIASMKFWTKIAYWLSHSLIKNWDNAFLENP